MISKALKLLPDILTASRLLLAVPIAVLIVEQQYSLVLWLALYAGITDALDGWLARRLKCQNRFGAIADPLADKALLTLSYIALAVVGLIPAWLAAIVVLRDVVIVTGSIFIHYRFGRYDIEPSAVGKFSTFVQVVFVLLVIAQQVQTLFPAQLLACGQYAVLVMACASGGQYVLHGARRVRGIRSQTGK